MKGLLRGGVAGRSSLPAPTGTATAPVLPRLALHRHHAWQQQPGSSTACRSGGGDVELGQVTGDEARRFNRIAAALVARSLEDMPEGDEEEEDEGEDVVEEDGPYAVRSHALSHACAYAHMHARPTPYHAHACAHAHSHARVPHTLSPTRMHTCMHAPHPVTHLHAHMHTHMHACPTPCHPHACAHTHTRTRTCTRTLAPHPGCQTLLVFMLPGFVEFGTSVAKVAKLQARKDRKPAAPSTAGGDTPFLLADIVPRWVGGRAGMAKSPLVLC